MFNIQKIIMGDFLTNIEELVSCPNKTEIKISVEKKKSRSRLGFKSLLPPLNGIIISTALCKGLLADHREFVNIPKNFISFLRCKRGITRALCNVVVLK